MKKVLILSAAILATSVLHAGAASSPQPAVLQAGRIRIMPGQTCGQTPFNPVVPDGTTTTTNTAVTATVASGDTSLWVTSAAFRKSTTPGFAVGVQVCLNAPNPNLAHPRWVYFTIVATPQI